MNEGQPPRAPGSCAFPTTQWSLIVHAGAGSESQVRAALETLCRQYWYPLYAFARRTGRAHHEAEDCTQDFLARFLSTEGITRAHSDRGSFRAFLLSSLRNFLTNEWHHGQAAKRGGGTAIVSLDFERAENRFDHEPKDAGLTPEQAYDRSWAHGLLDGAIASLRDEYHESGRGSQFAAIVPFVWESPGEGPASESAARVGMSAHAFTVALHRLRRRLGVRLRAIVAETVADPKDVDSELRHLIAVLGRQRG